MSKFEFYITTEFEKDLKLIKEMIKKNIHPISKKYFESDNLSITFDSDYGQYELVDEISKSFEYNRYEEVGIGKYDIKIHLKRVETPHMYSGNTDAIEENIYFGFCKEKNLYKVKIRQLSYKKVNGFVAVMFVKLHETGEVGYQPVAFPAKTTLRLDIEKCDRLTNGVYETEKEAFEMGIELTKKLIDRVI